MKKTVVFLFLVVILGLSIDVAANSSDMSDVVKELMDKSTIGANVYVSGERQEEHRLRRATLKDNVLTVSINSDVIYMSKAYSLTDPMFRFDGWAKKVSKEIAAHYVRELFSLEHSIYEVVFEIWIPVYVGRYGNIEMQLAGVCSMGRSTYEKIIWDNIMISMVADLLEDDWSM